MARNKNQTKENQQHLSGDTNETNAITEPTLEGQAEEQASNDSTEQADGTSEAIGDPVEGGEN